MVVVAGIDVPKAMLDVTLAEGPVYRFANSGPDLRRLLQHRGLLVRDYPLEFYPYPSP